MTCDPICPKCGNTAKMTHSDRFGARHSCCGLWSWGYKPLVSGETHEARKLAHMHFDRLWRRGDGFSRSKAYKMLAKELGISQRNCHISLMDADMALRVCEISDKLYKKLEGDWIDL